MINEDDDESQRDNEVIHIVDEVEDDHECEDEDEGLEIDIENAIKDERLTS